MTNADQNPEQEPGAYSEGVLVQDAGRSPATTIFKNAAAITAGTLALKALNFLFRVYIVRALGDELFGQYSIVIAFVGLFQIIAEPGITQYVMREIARDRTSTEKYFWNLVVVRLILALISIFIVTAAAFAFSYNPTIIFAIFLYTLTFVLAAFEIPMHTVLTAHERFDYTTMLNIVGQVAFAVLGTIVLFTGQGITWLVGVGLLAMLPQIALAARFIHRQRLLRFKVQITPRIWPMLLRAGFPFAATSLSLVIAQSIDTLILAWFWPAQEVGWYNAAYRLAISLLFLFEGFNTALVPSLSRAFVTDQAYVRTWYFRSVRVIALVGLPLAVGGMLVAYPLISLLYTADFAPAAPAFQVLIWDVPFIMFAFFCGNMTTIVNKERAAARINTINAGANIVLNMIFIPRYGLMAAAVITVLTDMLAALQFHFTLSKEMKLPNILPMLARVIVAAAGMGVVVFLVPLLFQTMSAQVLLILQIGLGIVVYGGLIYVLRVLDETDWSVLRRAANRGWGLVFHR